MGWPSLVMFLFLKVNLPEIQKCKLKQLWNTKSKLVDFFLMVALGAEDGGIRDGG